MKLQNFCGKLVSEDTPVFTSHSKLTKYGHGIFETILCLNAEPILLEAHYDRMRKGMELLHLKPSLPESCDQLRMLIAELLQNNGMTNAVARIQVFQQEGGLFDRSETGFLLNTIGLPPFKSGKTLACGLFREIRKSIDCLSNLKHCNFLPYSLAAAHAVNRGWDDAIILNIHDRICDSSIANVFVVRKNILYTPALEEGCVAGVCRQYLLQQLPEKGYDILETAMTEAFLLEADEIFLTNSVRGIQPLDFFEGRKYPVSFGNMVKKDLAYPGNQ